MLVFKNMSCGYGEHQAVNELSLAVRQGSVFALIGSNGAGKTSSIMAIAGHVQVQGGEILYKGKDLSQLPIKNRVQAGIALVPEGRRLFPDMSVEENLAIGGYFLSKAQKLVNQEKILHWFPRLQERLSQLAGSLSGGEQQMLAIGRALMAEPQLLLIDELSLGLMPKVVDLCYDVIWQLKGQGMTTLIVEQNTTRALDIADHVCVLESGKAVWQGSNTEAKNDPDLINIYLGIK